MEIVLCVSTVVEIGFLVLDRKVQSLYFTYIACAGERLLLLKVECRERSGRNNRSDLAIEVRSLSCRGRWKGRFFSPTSRAEGRQD